MHLKKVMLFIFVFILLSPTFANAQTKIDSLTNLLQTAKGESRVDILNTLSWKLKGSDPNRALKLNKESIDLSMVINYEEGEAKAYYYLANILKQKGDYSASLQASNTSFTLYKKLNNSLYLAKIWNLRGSVYLVTNKYSDANENFEKALTIGKVLENESFCRTVQTNMAGLHFHNGDYPVALEKYQMLSKEWLAKGDSIRYFRALNNAALAQFRLGKYPEALSTFFEIEPFEASKNRTYRLAETYSYIGLIYLNLTMLDQAHEMFEKALRLYEEIGNREQTAYVNSYIGIYFSESNEIEKADSCFQKAMLHDSLNISFTGSLYTNFAVLRNKSQEYEEAISLLNKALEINETIGSKEQFGHNYRNLGEAYFGLKQMQKSEEYYLKALDIWSELESVYEKKGTAESLVEIYKLNGKDNKFEQYSKIAQIAADSIINLEKLIEINRVLAAKIHTEFDNKTKVLQAELSTTKLKLEQSENKYTSFFSKYKIFFIFLSTIFIIGMIWLSKNRKKTSASENVKIQDSDDYKNLKESLNQKNKQLAILSMETAQNNEFLEKLHSTLQNLTAKNPNNLEIKKLEKVLNSNHISQHNWNHFISYFNESYHGFFDRISNSYPNITTKELRLCALIRLRIPSYEASIILGISLRSVHTARYRIRKKLDLASEENLENFLCSL